MTPPPVHSAKLSADPLFWSGLFASPLLSCILLSMGDRFLNDAGPFFGIILILITLAGAFYCGFRMGWICLQGMGGRVVLSLVFTAGLLILDFAVFFIGCCATFSLH